MNGEHLTKESGRHGVAQRGKWVPGEGYMAVCKCGRTFKSESWEHVPALYDHLAIADEQDRRIGSLKAVCR